MPVITTNISDITTQLTTQCSDFISDQLFLRIFTGILVAGYMPKAGSHCYHLSPEAEIQSLFPPKVAQFLLVRISKNATLKQTWISLTLFADSMRQTPAERQNAPVRKKLESTVTMLSWGFQAGSFCCLNALLSGHLEGCASPSCERTFVLFFIFFLVRGRNNILMLDSLLSWVTVLTVGRLYCLFKPALWPGITY